MEGLKKNSPPHIPDEEQGQALKGEEYNRNSHTIKKHYYFFTK